jgi:AraC-like DNA-binding protein
MLADDHITLRLIKLKPSEEWLNKGDGLSFFFSKEGAGKYVSKSATQKLAAGDVLVLKGSAGDKLCAHEKSGWVVGNFSLLVEHLFPLFGSNEIGLLQNVIDNFKTARTYSEKSILASECRQLLAAVHPEVNLEHRSQLLRIAAAVLSAEFKNVQTQRGGFIKTEDRMIQVFDKLSTEELLNFSVGELAKKFGCSRRHLNRLFHQHFGLSVASLRMEMRLMNAVNLLRDPEAKVINVAEQCGFNHLGLFNICFKRRFGASPGRWRKSNLQPESAPVHQAASRQVCPLNGNVLCAWSGQVEKASRAPGLVIPSSTNIQGRASFQ